MLKSLIREFVSVVLENEEDDPYAKYGDLAKRALAGDMEALQVLEDFAESDGIHLLRADPIIRLDVLAKFAGVYRPSFGGGLSSKLKVLDQELEVTKQSSQGPLRIYISNNDPERVMWCSNDTTPHVEIGMELEYGELGWEGNEEVTVRDVSRIWVEVDPQFGSGYHVHFFDSDDDIFIGKNDPEYSDLNEFFKSYTDDFAKACSIVFQILRMSK